MKTYYLKIRDKFISDIKNRVKKHEYRLASPERMQAKVGDTFVLISNQNRDKVTLNELRDYGVLDKYSGPRPFTFMTQEQFDTIYKLGMEE